MKKLMILGAAKTQIPIIKLSKKRGFETIVVTCSGDYPGLKYADKVYQIDITDKEKVLEAAKAEQVDGIVTDQLDFSVPSVAYVSEKLGLPSIGYDCALRFTNKYMMRNECSRLGIHNPKYYKVSTLDDAMEKSLDIGFPLIMKPTDSAGSRGIHVIRNISELESKFEHTVTFSKEHCAIMEKYIEGKEYVVGGFASNYKFTNLVIGERQMFDIPDTFIPCKTLFTSVPANHIEERILDVNKRLVEGFGLKFGVTHCEYIVEEKTGDVYLVECAARGAAICISSHLIPYATGIDANSLLLDIAVGNAEEIEIKNIATDVSAYLLFTLPKGFVKEIRGVEKIKSVPNVQKVYIDSMYVGMETEVMTDKGQRKGPILIKTSTKEDCENTIRKIKAVFEIDVETSEGVKGIIW